MVVNLSKSCPNCSVLNNDSAFFCYNCGYKFDKNSTEHTMNLDDDKISSKSEILAETVCPNCGGFNFSHLIHRKILFNKKIYICSDCGITFEKKKSKYILKDIKDKDSKIWLGYANKSLKKEEWIRIFAGGLSDDEIAKQKVEIQLNKENELKIQDKEDLYSFVNELFKIIPPFPPLANIPINLDYGEIAYLYFDSLELWEHRTVIVSHGSFGGPVFQVNDNFAYGMGGGESVSESHEELKHVDDGSLTLTNQRLIFMGENKTLNIYLDSILAINEYNDAIAISTENSQVTEYFKGIESFNLNYQINGRNYSKPFHNELFKLAIQGRIINF